MMMLLVLSSSSLRLLGGTAHEHNTIRSTRTLGTKFLRCRRMSSMALMTRSLKQNHCKPCDRNDDSVSLLSSVSLRWWVAWTNWLSSDSSFVRHMSTTAVDTPDPSWINSHKIERDRSYASYAASPLRGLSVLLLTMSVK